MIGSATGERFLPGQSDIDLVAVIPAGPFQRYSVQLLDPIQTVVDISTGTPAEVFEHYAHGAGKAYLKAFEEAVIYLDDQTGTTKKLWADLIAELRPTRTEPAWRITLTNQCNFGCFFCHGEGLDADQHFNRPDFTKIYQLILEGITHGCSDFTLTGGEPLLFADEIANMLDKLSGQHERPSMTVVTNGLLLTDSFLRAAKGYGKIKINISFHSTNEATYQKIIRRNGAEFGRVTSNIGALGAQGIPFCLNYVLLRNLNDELSQIDEMLVFAEHAGATSVKFLELLVLDKLIGYFDYYSDVRRVEELLLGRVRLVRDWGRRREYIYGNGPMRVFVQRCRCRWGCNRCMETMDRIITPELCYEPCFVENGYTIDLAGISLQGAFTEGDGLIAKMKQRYGEGSPLIVKDPEEHGQKVSYFYTTPLSAEEAGLFLSEAGWKMVRVHGFKETYYRPDNAGKVWQEFNTVCKSFVNDEYPEKHRFFTANYDSFQGDEGWQTVARFSAMREFTKTGLIDCVAAAGLNEWFSLSWRLFYYSKNNVEISIGICAETPKVSVGSHNQPAPESIVKGIKLKRLEEPLPRWVMV